MFSSCAHSHDNEENNGEIVPYDEKKQIKKQNIRPKTPHISPMKSLSVRYYKSFGTTRTTFKTLLRDKHFEDIFREHLQIEFAEEVLNLYESIEDFKSRYSDMSYSTRKSIVKKLYNIYISDTSSYQVNLPETLKTDILEKINSNEEISYCVFDKIQKELFNMLYGSYQRFESKKFL